MEKKLPTIKEIARRLNISISTVSRALHDHPSIGLRTKMQVKKLAQELNYIPNQTAIFFKQGKTFTIGVVLPNLREEYFSSAISGIEETAFDSEYIALIGQSHDDLNREKKIVETMKKHRVDGLLVSVSKETRGLEHFEELKQYNIPVVFFDRVPDAPDIHSVWCSLYHSSIAAIDFLVKKGHKRIGYIQGPSTLNIKNERLQGYVAGLKKNKIVVDELLIESSDLSLNSTQQALDKLLAAKNRPTAIVTFNDYVALDAMKFARKKKLKINKDISFVSYANLPVTTYLETPPLASVEQFPFEQGVRATELLLRLIKAKSLSENVPYENVVLGSELVIH
ncbi:MAG: LacI family DNA-binding transcriptional regulator [Chitinophagaceae bacterium]|nr:LacI family DNA-binding transcriptional regulator [Chitinophagaceae bacterium]